jgi:large subunit ribosomal protein L10e
MGNREKEYEVVLHLVSMSDVVVRDNALEAARQSANKLLEKKVPGNYYFVVRVFPHHVIRENRMLAGAGADRLQQGMRRAFGKPTSKAARIFKGTEVFTVFAFKKDAAVVKEALFKANLKMSGKYRVVEEDLSKPTTPFI